MRMRVSLCLITRDKALALPACLNSVAGLADEIIVVDTGSLDNTRKVARELGARVHDFAWVDDFAAAPTSAIVSPRAIGSCGSTETSISTRITVKSSHPG